MFHLFIENSSGESSGVVWAILFSALLGAVFTALLVWFLTARNRKLEQERSKATLYYASKEAELAAREIRNKAELDIDRKWTELRAAEARTRLDLEQREAEILKQEKLLAENKKEFEAAREKFEHENASLRRGRQRVGRMIRTYRSLMEEAGKMDSDEARQTLFALVRQECEDDLRQFRRELLERSQKEIENTARRKLITAMQRIASNPGNDAIAALINLPDENMEGRIIGREGRNIKCFEATAGVTILIDESPDTLLISCFDPVRREIAKLAMEALIADGRIHPATIEEQVKIATETVNTDVIRYGEAAIDKLNLTGVHHEILTLLGRLKYRFSLNQNVLDHSIEVAFLSSMLAAELGLDPIIAKRAGLFHDIGKAVSQEFEGSHALVGAELLRRHGEPQPVINAVAAHHEEVNAETLYAGLLIAADTLSSTRPGARTESQGNYLLRLQRLERLATELPGVEEAYAIEAGREIRVIVSPDRVPDDEARKLARTIRTKIEEELQYPSVIKVTVIREQRFTETAK